MLLEAEPTPYVKAVRKIYANAFQSCNLRTIMPKLDKVFERLLCIIEAKREAGPLDFQSLFVRFTLDAIGVVALDLDHGGLDQSRPLCKLLLRGGYLARLRYVSPWNRIYCTLFPKSAEAKRQNAVFDSLTAEYDKLAKEILEKENPPKGQEPVWLALRNLKDPETNKPIAYTTLRAEVATVLGAGTDTTGHQLGWLFALLASHPQVVSNVLDELTAHGLHGPNARDVTFDDLSELSYLTATIKEAMRLGGVTAFSFLRLVPRDMTILGYRVPKDTIICCPGNRTFNTDAEWGDGKVFRPERWLTDEDLSSKYNHGFSYGPRDCVGQKLAMLQMRLMVVKLLTRYEFSLAGELEEIFENAIDGVVIESRNGIMIHAKPRSVANSSHPSNDEQHSKLNS